MNIIRAIVKDNKYKKFVAFCNALRCPLCGGQLDGSVHPDISRLYCVNYNDEYKAVWTIDTEMPLREQIVFYYPQYMYEINIYYKGDNIFDTKIDRLNMDMNMLHRESSRKNVFDFYGDRILFFRKRMYEKQFLDKLSLYNLFS